MPHVILAGAVDLGHVGDHLTGTVHRWRAAVIKAETCWLRSDGRAALVEGVVIEHSRPLHPVAVISLGRGDTSVRLWRQAPVERTPAVQRWLATIAHELRRLGAGPMQTTNIAVELLEDLELADPARG